MPQPDAPTSAAVESAGTVSVKPCRTGVSVRVGGASYELVKTGVEVQRLYAGYDKISTSYSGGRLNFLRLTATLGGLSETTACVPPDATASELAAALNGLDLLDGVDVSRSGSGKHGDAYLWSIYFDGTPGNVPPLEVSYGAIAGCNKTAAGDAVASGADVGVVTVTEGGASEVQTLTLAVDSGYVEGYYYKLKAGDAETSNCLEWGAPAADIEAAINADLTSLTASALGVRVNAQRADGTKILHVANWTENDGDVAPLGPWRDAYFDGELFVGDKLMIDGDKKPSRTYTVVDVANDGRWVELDSRFRAAASGASKNATVYVVRDAVSVRRSGLGN